MQRELIRELIGQLLLLLEQMKALRAGDRGESNGENGILESA
jgi:hypothetical protein